MSEQILKAIGSLQSTVKATPDAAQAVFRATTVSGDDSFSTTSKVRGFEVRLDEPQVLGGSDTGPNPVEAVLVALGSCQAIVYRAYANALGVKVDRVEVEARGQLDLRGFLGDGRVHAGFSTVDFVARITSPEAPERIAELAAIVDAHCPVLDTLKRAVSVSRSLEHVGAQSTQRPAA